MPPTAAAAPLHASCAALSCIFAEAPYALSAGLSELYTGHAVRCVAQTAACCDSPLSLLHRHWRCLDIFATLM
jgi:hypothetical protein